MSYPPVINLQSFLRAKDEASIGTPDAEDSINVAMAVIDNYDDESIRGHRLGDGLDVIEALLRVAFVPQADSPPPTPSVAPPQPSGSQGEAGTTNSQMPFTPFCSETPISQPISPTPEVCGEQMGTGKVGMTPRAKGTKKPSTPKALSAGDELSVFDIHNTFRRCWFLSRDHLVANAILA
jgi:hypothetical protein